MIELCEYEPINHIPTLVGLRSLEGIMETSLKQRPFMWILRFLSIVLRSSFDEAVMVVFVFFMFGNLEREVGMVCYSMQCLS